MLEDTEVRSRAEESAPVDEGEIGIESETDGNQSRISETEAEKMTGGERDINDYVQDELGHDSGSVEEILSQMGKNISEQGVTTSKISKEIRELHKLYHNEFAGRLRNMQDELETYHDIDRGRVYDDILREVARIYCDNEELLGADADEKLKKRIKYLFMDIEQLLEANGVKIQRSSPGEKRNNKFCQIVERVETTDLKKHDTVVCSKRIGFYTEKRPLIKERFFLNFGCFTKKQVHKIPVFLYAYTSHFWVFLI